MLNNDVALRVRQAARITAYHRGPAMNYQDLAHELDLQGLVNLRSRFVAEQAELAGFPVWTTAPDEALNPNA